MESQPGLQTIIIHILHNISISGESGLVGSGVEMRIRRFLVQTPLGASLGLRTHPRYEAPGDLRV